MSTIPELNRQSTRSFETTWNTADSGVGSSSQLSHLQAQVSVLTNSINNEALRIAVGKVLTDMVFLLDSLSMVAGPRAPGGIHEVFTLLNIARSRANSLALFIESNALRLEGLDDRLSETLDSSAYAIKHEVRRVFNGDLAQMSIDRDDQETRAVIQHAQGVLINCFQHCMINVARLFDASLTDAGLFLDWQSRRDSSLVLYQDLSELIALVQESMKDSLQYAPEQSLDHLEERLASFQGGSMQYLMYKDWQQFESLSEAIVTSIRSGEGPTDRLHHMGCYLETLLAHVKARSVLADLAL